MSIAITGRQRELFYGIALSRLTAIDGVWRAVEDHEWEDAQRLGREFSDLLRLVVTISGLGGGPGRSGSVHGPSRRSQRAIQILRREALVEDDEQREKRLEVSG